MAGEGQGDAEGLSFRLLEEIVDDSFTGTHEALLGKPIGALLLRHADGVYRGAGRMVAAHGKYVADPSLSVEIEDGTVRGSFDNIPFGSRTARSDEAEHLGLWARLIYRQDKPGTSPRFIDVVPAVPPGVAVSVVHPIPAPSLEVAVVEPVTPPPTPPVPPPTPVPAPSLEPSSGRYVLVPREGVVPDKALLEADPDRYLAQGIELRLREWYDAGTDRFRLPHVAGTYQPREELPYNLVRAILERATSTGEFGRLKKDHRLMRYRDVSDGCVALEDVLALHFIKISDAKKYGVDDIARFFGVAEEDIIFLGSEKGYFPSSTREKQSYLVQQAFRDALHTAFDAMVQGKSLFSESQLTSIPFVDLSAQAYDPNRLVTALWVIYQATGCTPDQTEIIDQALMQLFHSQHMRLVPVETQGVYASRYRAGDFTDAHFSALGKTAREVLTDPYACERNPDEEIGRTHIARELGLSKYSAGRLFRKAVQDTGTTLTVDLATRKRARRGDIHKALGLPGWFPGDAPSTSSVAVPAVPAVSEEQRGELEEAVAEEPAEPEQARSVPPPSLASSLDAVVAQIGPASPPASVSEPVSLSTYEVSLAASLQQRLVAEGYYRSADRNVVLGEGVSYAYDHTLSLAPAAAYLGIASDNLRLTLKNHGFPPRKIRASTVLKMKLWREGLDGKFSSHHLASDELAALFGATSNLIAQCNGADLFTPTEKANKPKHAGHFQTVQRRVFYRVFDTALEGLLAGSVETDSRAEPTTAEQASDSVAELVPAPASSSPALAPSPALDLETRAASAPIPPDPILSDSAPLYQCDPEAYLAGHLKARLAQKEYHKFGEDGTHYLLLKSTQYYRADHVFPLPNAVSLFPIERLPLERFVEGLGKPEVHGVTARDLALFLLGNTKMKRINNETTPRVIASAFSHLYEIPEGEDDAVTHILGLSDSNRKKNHVAFQRDLFYRVGRKVIDDLLSEEAPAPAPSPPAPASVADSETTPTPDHDGDAQALEELSATLSEMKARVAKLKPLDVEKIPVLDWTSFDKGHGDLQTLLSTLKQEREQPPAQELSDLAVEEPSSPTPSSRSAVPEPALVFDNQYATAYLAESLRTRILNEGHFHAVQRRIKLPNGELYSLSRYLDVGRVHLATKIPASRVHEFVNRYKLSEANGIPVAQALKILLWAQVVKTVDPLTLESHAQLYGATPQDMQKVHTLTTLFVPKTADIAPEDQKKAIKDRQREVYFDVFRVALDVLTYERSVERVLHLEGNATEVFAQATVGQIDASSLSSSSSSSSASVADDKPEPVLRQPTLEMIRVTPPLVDGYYDYGLQVPLTYEAQRDPLSAFVQAYAPEFARRMLEAFVEEGYLTHAGFVLGHKREGRKQVVDFDRFVPLLTFLDFMPGTRDQVAGAITALVPRNLRNSTAKTLEVHSYAAAVLCYNPLQNKRPRDKFTLDLALEAWYIAGHKRDVQLATFLEATPLVLSPRGLSGSYLTNEKFFDVYYPLAMRWAQTMHNDATRKHLMEEVGYVDETGFGQMLVEQGVASDKAYSAIDKLPGSQVLLGMVHARKVPAIAKTLLRS